MNLESDSNCAVSEKWVMQLLHISSKWNVLQNLIFGRFTIFFFFLLAYSYVEMNNFVVVNFYFEERIELEERKLKIEKFT